LTAGNFKAVMQEVIVTDKTIAALNVAKELHRNLWGISSSVSDYSFKFTSYVQLLYY
jgi:hypothetical protein